MDGDILMSYQGKGEQALREPTAFALSRCRSKLLVADRFGGSGMIAQERVVMFRVKTGSMLKTIRLPGNASAERGFICSACSRKILVLDHACRTLLVISVEDARLLARVRLDGLGLAQTDVVSLVASDTGEMFLAHWDSNATSKIFKIACSSGTDELWTLELPPVWTVSVASHLRGQRLMARPSMFVGRLASAFVWWLSEDGKMTCCQRGGSKSEASLPVEIAQALCTRKPTGCRLHSVALDEKNAWCAMTSSHDDVVVVWRVVLGSNMPWSLARVLCIGVYKSDASCPLSKLPHERQFVCPLLEKIIRMYQQL
ncbi:hypothetical protein GUITHDRAFT_121853 [Guillardia theta CCMP2712]|uniref:Uncharacterized protein n=1 Tax=Guillardia theta (strain CCMP2712) TaxID=905079 RepID=L1I7Z1_GUITC|nr:hypothetical protein GUITHDRAFT_121853 [Guillardia theta CCMP2712]EKX31980.1 hypothetical protein GUITHDRAFT_121853 [Guillardia theta CCMP2712]|eukprot:XP_005818960.1 hypothetical protein GUITHDRAFT_121853 [Guillardia theta CCMP2712]